MLLAASGIIALVLLAGLSASLWQMRRAMQAEADANTNEGTAKHNAQQAEESRRDTEKALKIVESEKTRALTAEGLARTEEEALALVERGDGTAACACYAEYGHVGMTQKRSIDTSLNPKITKSRNSTQGTGFNESNPLTLGFFSRTKSKEHHIIYWDRRSKNSFLNAAILKGSARRRQGKRKK